MTSRSPPAGSRRGLWLGAAGLLVLASGAWFALRPGVSPPRKAGPPARNTAAHLLSPTVPPPVVRAAPVRPPPKRAALPPALPVAPSGDTAPPVVDPLNPSDPSEAQHGEGLEIRTLVSVGDIQLGLVGEARVRDERGLKNVLVQIGKDLEKSSRQLGSEAPPELQQLLDGYREELGQYMAGEVEIRGPGWMIGTEVGPPRRLGEGWRPRPY